MIKLKKLYLACLVLLLLSSICYTEDKASRSELKELGIAIKNDEATKVPVLLYHHILPHEDMDKYGWNNNSLVISLESFEEQMKYLYDNHYHTATLDELEQFMSGKLALPKNTVVITFDDGYLSNAVNAYPVMKKYLQRATIFMGYKINIEKQDYSPAALQFIHKDDLDKYSDVFDYECHTYNMHHMTNGKADLESFTYDEIKADLLTNKEELKASYIAYPFGKYNDTAIKAVKDLGFKLGFTVKFGYATKKTPKYEVPRIIIYPNTSMQIFKGYLH